jgi:hypothetical protein
MLALPSLSSPSIAGQRAVVGLLAECREGLFNVPDLGLRLFRVVAELLLELLALRLLLEVPEHLEHGVLHLQRGAKLVVKQLLR